MTILPQFELSNTLKNLFVSIQESTNYLLEPTNQEFTIRNYSQFIEHTSEWLRIAACDYLVQNFELLDLKFKNSALRKRDYYVHQTRERTLITVFGVVKFKRTIYKDKTTGKTFIYVDRKLGLPKYDRYDPCVKCMIVETFANQNSMIKVGEQIGDRIFSSFSTSQHREHYRISRQTVYNTVKRPLPSLSELCEPKPTPSHLYIMADEKYVHMQRNESQSVMVKSAVIFEGIKGPQKRRQLINKMVYSGTESNFWNSVYDLLSITYDMDKIKNITILGDGALWIKSGTREFSHSSFALDKFHFKQALNHITTDKPTKEILASNIINGNTETFNQIIQTLIDGTEQSNRQKTIEEKCNYILRNTLAIQYSYNGLKIGCSMESAISHNLASIYSNRPKGYCKENLNAYLNLRNLFLNHIDIRNLYLDSIDPKSIKQKEAKYDFSMFEQRNAYDKSSSSRWLKAHISRN
ncbi:UPF0236 family protein [Erysipelothrix inopinata]|uniref:UPF0236 family protein n=1 Tax=Erysipelothrix inopinata TaxID=225084 RepID=A0A7G9S1E0_9FIRM|nr:UPF0236 family protein [Erysipelothrix inopinata]QNN60178.1 UPF0236 family protein [Erysipelothrix inopinata]QNN60487.1 UPF0236 family protein [Erysipelothrix inopinata]QNN60680.1 UPF0236 family protein [Erysipelothrix inopinata]QNN61342.1 UPF0236 family protein [Erysipelothrix inopinata]QNN61464.1 UPF0236 family protein [Erysipelothrix inopinata]